MDRRTRLVEIFRDTQRFYEADPALVAAVAASKAGTKLYDGEPIPALPANTRKAGTVTVTRSKTFEAAMRLAKQYTCN